MYEVVVEERQVTEGIPMMMPTTAEVTVGEEEALRIRAAASSGELFVRIGGPDAGQRQVTKIWPNPHNPRQITLFLADA